MREIQYIHIGKPAIEYPSTVLGHSYSDARNTVDSYMKTSYRIRTNGARMELLGCRKYCIFTQENQL